MHLYLLPTNWLAPLSKGTCRAESIGRFHDNLTLRCVCEGCNSCFAEELELFLTRDSVEALLRVRYGLKTASGRHRLCESRLIVKVITPGDWHGARISVERNAAGTALRADPLPQVAFRKHGETDWKWFLEEDIGSTKELGTISDGHGHEDRLASRMGAFNDYPTN